MSFVREFVWDPSGDWYRPSWRYAGNPFFRPADARINAHDALEHFLEDSGEDVSGEFEAIGALWYGRVQAGVFFAPPFNVPSLKECVLGNAGEVQKVLQEVLLVKGATHHILPFVQDCPPAKNEAMDACIQEVVEIGVNGVILAIQTADYLSATRTYLELSGEAVSKAILRANHARLFDGTLKKHILALIRNGFRKAHERYGSAERLASLYRKVYKCIEESGLGSPSEMLRLEIDIEMEKVSLFRGKLGDSLAFIRTI